MKKFLSKVAAALDVFQLQALMEAEEAAERRAAENSGEETEELCERNKYIGHFFYPGRETADRYVGNSEHDTVAFFMRKDMDDVASQTLGEFGTVYYKQHQGHKLIRFDLSNLQTLAQLSVPILFVEHNKEEGGSRTLSRQQFQLLIFKYESRLESNRALSFAGFDDQIGNRDKEKERQHYVEYDHDP